MLFVNFSLAFNTIIPQHLVKKLAPLGLNTPLLNWILDLLTKRPQFSAEYWFPSGVRFESAICKL